MPEPYAWPEKLQNVILIRERLTLLSTKMFEQLQSQQNCWREEEEQ